MEKNDFTYGILLLGHLVYLFNDLPGVRKIEQSFSCAETAVYVLQN